MVTTPTIGSRNWGTVNNAALDNLQAQITALKPGTELGYAEKTALFTTTATGLGTAIAALSVTVTGAGRPVDVEFFAPNVFHSTANTFVTTYLRTNAVELDANAQVASASSPSTTAGPALYFKKRIVLTDGVSYTFDVCAFSAGGTCTFSCASAAPLFLSVTSR